MHNIKGKMIHKRREPHLGKKKIGIDRSRLCCCEFFSAVKSEKKKNHNPTGVTVEGEENKKGLIEEKKTKKD